MVFMRRPLMCNEIKKAPIKRVRFYSDKRLSQEMRGISNDDLVDVPEAPKKNFWKHTPFGRTLSLRNKTGKTIAGFGLSVIGAITGVQLDFIPQETIQPMFLLLQDLATDFTITQTLIAISGVIIAFVIGFFVKNKALASKLEEIADDVSDELIKATDPKSDGKEKITRNEVKSMVLSLLKKHLKK